MFVQLLDGTEILIGLRENSVFKQYDIAIDLADVAFDLTDIAFELANIAFDTTKPRIVTEQYLHHCIYVLVEPPQISQRKARNLTGLRCIGVAVCHISILARLAAKITGLNPPSPER